MTAPLNDDQAPEVDQDQTPPAGGDNDQHGRETRQDRRDRQARQRAQELEGERDKLAARLDARDRAEVTRLAGEILAQGGDLLELGKVDLADLLDADGNVDPDAVAKAAAALVETRPGLAAGATRPRGYADWGHSKTSDPYFRDGPGYEGEGTSSWSDAFGSAGRGGAHYT